MRRAALAWIATALLASALLTASGPASAAGEAIEVRASGWQIYACETSPPGFAWRLRAPEAALLDVSGDAFGRHFAGPTWEARDGGTVVGEVLVSSPAPRPGSIPWLLLRAKSHAGDGVLASVGFIARTHTEGGVAPAAGCDAAHAWAESRVPYNALYVFFPRS